MRAIRYQDVAASEFGLRGGGGSAGIKTLIEGTNSDIDNFAVYLQELDDSFFTPRHRHNFDQFRIALQQPYNIAPKTDLQPGEIAYFPEGAYYGPQNGKPGTTVLSLHFTGPSRARYINLPELSVGLRELKRRGTVANGVFTETTESGGKRNQDSYEAVWEHIQGAELIYPKPRYAAPIMIRPQEFTWKVCAHDVRVKHLGTFTECEAAVRMYEAAGGANIPLGMDTHRCVIVVLQGTIAHGGSEFGKYSCFLTSLAERCELSGGEGGATLIEFVLPDLRG